MSLRHERRRRYYADDQEMVDDDEPSRTTAASEPAGAAKAYTEAAQHARQRAVSSLLPSGLLSIGLCVGGCLLMILACLGLHFAADALSTVVPAEDAAILRLDAPGSIGHWLASTLLVVAGVAAMFVFSLRRHRIDDYHGRYRVWLWVFVACMLASIAQTTHLDRLARRFCQFAAEWSGMRNDVLWPAATALVGLAMGVRLLFEIRHCRLAVVALFSALSCFLCGAACRHGWLMTDADPRHPLLAYGSWLVGYVCLLATFLCFARHVQLEVDGLIAVRARRKRAKTKKKHAPERNADESSDSVAKPALRLRTDLDPAPAAQQPTPSRTAAASSKPASSSANNAPLQQHLSRAERRRMRRESSRMAS